MCNEYVFLNMANLYEHDVLSKPLMQIRFLLPPTLVM